MPARATLDVACGTGYLTKDLAGDVTGLDFSAAMLEQAGRRNAATNYVRADGLALPFRDGAFERVFSSHFYGRLGRSDRFRFLEEARRVAPSFIVVDTPYQSDRDAEGPQHRELLDGTKYTIYKKYFHPEELLEEIGGGRILLSTKWYLVVEQRW